MHLGHTISPSLSFPQAPILVFTSSCPLPSPITAGPAFLLLCKFPHCPHKQSNLLMWAPHLNLPSVSRGPVLGSPPFSLSFPTKLFTHSLAIVFSRFLGCPQQHLPSFLFNTLPSFYFFFNLFPHGRSEPVLRTPRNGSFMKDQLSGSTCPSAL